MNSTSLSHLKKKPGGVQQLISESESDGTDDEDDEGVREDPRDDTEAFPGRGDFGLVFG